MMTVEELKKEGAIYFEKVMDGMQQYENQIIRMNAFQAVDKFMEMWEMLGCKNMYVDFYYFTLPRQSGIIAQQSCTFPCRICSACPMRRSPSTW